MGDFHWLSLQMLLDSALPIGSFAHSYGLETLVQDGAVKDGEDLRTYIAAMLRHGWAVSDLMAVKAAYAEGQDIDYACEIERRVHFQRLAPETRDGVVKTGRRLLKLAPELFPHLRLNELSEAVRAGRSLGTYPLVYGVICRELGVPLGQAAEGYLYACVTACAGAGLRLIPMGQNEAQRIVSASVGEIAEAWASVREMDPSDCYGAMPLAELAMIRHEKLYSRLFMS